MHDIRAIRENPDLYDAAWARRGLPPMAKKIVDFDAKLRMASTAKQEAEAQRNAASKAIGAAKVEFDQAYYADMAALIAAEIAEVVAANQILMAGTWGGRGGLGLAAMNEIEMNGSILAPIPDASPSIALTIYANGVVVFSGVIPNEKAFKLPAGYRAHTLAYRWQANTKVRCLVLGETMKSLAGA